MRSFSTSSMSRAHCGALLLLSCLLATMLAVAPGAEAATLQPYDLSKDWLSDIMAKGPNGCIVAPPATNRSLPAVPKPGPGNLTVQQIIAQGWRLAPKIYMHPLEWSLLADPAKWLNSVPIYDPVDLTTTNLSSLSNYTDQWQLLVYNMLGARFFASGIWTQGFNTSTASNTTTTAQLKQRIWGDPPDAKNRSTAVVWYTAMDAADAKDKVAPITYARGEAVIFKFHFFYPFNGCSNQLLALAIGGKYQGIEYYMCPPGVHEGDLEHISMLVSVARYNPSDPFNSIMRVQYAAHSWNSQYDCYLGECQSEVDDAGLRRLVSYSGLYSHASYPKPSALQLYMKVSADFLLNVDGVYIGDRTAKTVGYSNGTTFGGVVFQPTANNTRFLPFMDNMTKEQINGEFAWAAYPGSFGGYIITANQTSIPCFYGNFSSEGPCQPDNPATSYINFFLELKAGVPPINIDQLVWLNSIKAPFAVDPILGPLYRTYTYTWETSNAPPLYDNNNGATCPFSGNPQETQTSADYSQPNVQRFLVSLAAILVGAAVLFCLALFFPLMSAESETKYLMRLMSQARHAARHGSTTLPGAPFGSAPFGSNANSNGAAISPMPGGAVAEGTITTLPGASFGNANSSAVAEGTDFNPLSAPTPQEAGKWAEAHEGKGAGGGAVHAVDGGEAAAKKAAWRTFWRRCCCRERRRGVWEPDTLNMGRHLGWSLLALGLSAGGIALTAVGIDGVVTATTEIYDMPLWHQIRNALIVVLIIFGVLHVLVIIGVIFFRNVGWIRLTFVKVYNPLSRWRLATRLGWLSNGINSGLHVLAINTTVLLFSFGVFLTVAKMIVQIGCNSALQVLFDNVEVSPYVCVDGSSLGLDVSFCGGDLTRICALWQGLSASFIAYGTLMLLLAHLLMLSLCVQQFVTMRNVLIAMDPKLRPLLDVDAEDEEHEQEEAHKRAQQMSQLENGPRP